jgi:hypothetical protein
MKVLLKATAIILLTLPGVLVVLAPTALEAGDASRGGTFLPMGWDAKGEGMAGAAACLIRDDRSAYWNPANLVYLTSPHVSLATTQPVPDLDNRYSVLSLGTGFMDTQPEPRVSERSKRIGAALIVSHLDLELAAGSSWGETTFGAACAFAINYYNSIGLTWRILESRTASRHDADASGMALDVGWTARLSERLWLGIVGRNIAGRISFPNRKEEFDQVWTAAIAYERLVNRISIEHDTVLRDGELARFLVGLDVTVVNDLLYALGGADFRLIDGKRTILHFGIATKFRYSEIALAFTIDPEDAFGRKTWVSISLFHE